MPDFNKLPYLLCSQGDNKRKKDRNNKKEKYKKLVRNGEERITKERGVKKKKDWSEICFNTAVKLVCKNPYCEIEK